MTLRRLPHRLVVWGNNNPFLMSLILALLIVVAGLVAFQIQNDRNIQRGRDQAVQEAKDRASAIAEALAASNLEVCKRAVTAVTNQSKADDLKLITAIKGRYAESGRPVPALYINLELIITNRQPPLASCEPKENP